MPRTSKYYLVPNEAFIQAVKESFSIAEALQKMGLCIYGSAYKTFKRRVAELQVDTSHFTGQGHLKDKTHNWSPKIALEEILVEDSGKAFSQRFKKRLIESGLIEYQCAKCHMTDTWQNEPITLQIDHINGNPFDHRIENLRFLCPNCHSQTPNFGSKNQKGKTSRRNEREGRIVPTRTKQIHPCVLCGLPCRDGRAKYCNTCWRDRRKELQTYTQPDKIVWPSLEELLLRLETTSFLQLGKELGVSDNAIRKRIQKYRKAA